MSDPLNPGQFYLLLKNHFHLVVPFFLACWMAWSDIRTRRIPNYLSLACALAGLGYQLGSHGLAGMADSFLGMGLGFTLLIFFYIMGGIGAGDVKALAALGAWLGPWQTLHLFVYMGISGGVLLIIFLWWKGLLWGKIRKAWGNLVNWVLLRPAPSGQKSADQPAPKSEGIPYAMALAVGMGILCWRSFTSQ